MPFLLSNYAYTPSIMLVRLVYIERRNKIFRLKTLLSVPEAIISGDCSNRTAAQTANCFASHFYENLAFSVLCYGTWRLVVHAWRKEHPDSYFELKHPFNKESM